MPDFGAMYITLLMIYYIFKIVQNYVNTLSNMDVKIQILRWSKKRPRFIIALAVFSGILLIASSVPKNASKEGITRVVIDAGHGGKDPGNLGTGRYKVTEKTIALDVSLKVGEYIKQAFPDVEVLYTRDNDTFVELHERSKFANTKNADLFISIHCDAFTKETAKGVGTFVMGAAKTEANLRMAQRENKAMLLEDNRDKNYDGFDPNSPEGLIELSLRQNAHIHQSLKFAQEVQDQMRERVGRIDRGVRQAPFWVISFTTMPSVLVELGFLTNKEEEDFLNSEKGKDYAASAIYRAFKTYKTNMETAENSAHPAPKEEKVEDIKPEVSETIAIKGVVFKVQLLSSSSKVELKPQNFKGMENVSEYADNGMYKYLYGSATTYDGAKNLQKSARQNGYKGAFVVAFDENENRIALEKAIQLTN